jgi:hypothetical protein
MEIYNLRNTELQFGNVIARRLSIFMLAIFFFWRYSPNFGLGLPPWNSSFHFGLLDLRHSVGLLGRVISSSQGLYLYIKHSKTHMHTPNIHALSGIRSHDPGFRASENSARLRPLGLWQPLLYKILLRIYVISLLCGTTLCVGALSLLHIWIRKQTVRLLRETSFLMSSL